MDSFAFFLEGKLPDNVRLASHDYRDLAVLADAVEESYSLKTVANFIGRYNYFIKMFIAEAHRKATIGLGDYQIWQVHDVLSGIEARTSYAVRNLMAHEAGTGGVYSRGHPTRMGKREQSPVADSLNNIIPSAELVEIKELFRNIQPAVVLHGPYNIELKTSGKVRMTASQEVISKIIAFLEFMIPLLTRVINHGLTLPNKSQ